MPYAQNYASIIRQTLPTFYLQNRDGPTAVLANTDLQMWLFFFFLRKAIF